MELQGERLIPADLQRTWNALNDPETLKACVAGCESLERSGDNSFDAVVAVKVGPVGARFNGRLELTNVRPPRAYTINFEGQGGAAGFGKGSSDVSLEPEGDNTRLRYTAKAQVGGKMAQIGSRLIDAAARKMTDDFFNAFEQRLQPAATAQAAAVPAQVAGRPSPSEASGRDLRTLWWLLAALLITAVIYFMVR
jgi:carbon monoxide dehydrogenase subunit G